MASITRQINGGGKTLLPSKAGIVRKKRPFWAVSARGAFPPRMPRPRPRRGLCRIQGVVGRVAAGAGGLSHAPARAGPAGLDGGQPL